jgi:hypothetical protein
MLGSVFQWPIDASKPHLGNCPIILLAHALGNDIDALSRNLGVHAGVFDSIVGFIDTQQLARVTGDGPFGDNQIALRTLVGKCNFKYRDEHTACNDAAVTLICAITLVLPKSLKPSSGTPPLQDIVDDIETSSQGQQWDWGSETYCVRCGSWGHARMGFGLRPCHAQVKCAHCAASKEKKRNQAARGHPTGKCIIFAMCGPEEEEIVAGLGELSLRSMRFPPA